MEGDNPVWRGDRSYVSIVRRVELFGNAALSGWYTPSKAKYQRETDSEQVQ